MAIYNCKVINDIGKKVNIIKEALDEESLKAYLKRDKMILLSCSLIQEKEPNTFFAVRSKISMNEVIMFLRQFAVMINAGITISDSLNILRNQKYTKAFKKVLLKVYEDVQSGVLLSEAFKKHPKTFPTFFSSMIAIGEVSGSLEEVLTSLADYYENDRKIKRKAKAALVYPAILSILLIVIFFFLTLYVLPQFEGMILEMGGDVPLITKIIMNISNFIKNNILFIIIGALLFILILYIYFQTNNGKYVKDYLKFHVPFVGKVERNLITSRFSKAFIILLKSGMSITDCMDNLRKMLGNKLFDKKFKYSLEEVKRGKRIAQAIENTNLFPPMLTEMINIGEKSGNIEEVLTSTSNYFDEQVEVSISKAIAAIEPVVIILLGAVVGIVILAVLLPMISLMQNI